MSADQVTDTGAKPVASWPGLRLPTPPAPTNPNEPRPAEERVVLEELRFLLENRLVAEKPPQTSDGSKADGLEPSRYEHGLWRAGWTDGRLGQTPGPQIELVASQASLTRSLRTGEATRKIAEAEAEQKHKQYIASQRAKEWGNSSGEFDRIEEDRRKNAASYSRFLAILYVFFGILIFIADLPLSFKVAPVLGVDTRARVGNEIVSADNLDELFANLGALWEPLAVAVGIAALTIAFKIVIDKLHRPHGFATWWSNLLLVSMMLATVSSAIWAFVLIGQARAVHAGVAASAVDRAKLFTILAIMFPVVSGYCFSMGRSMWQNVALYKRAANERDQAWNRMLTANLDAERAVAAVTSAQAELDAVGKNTIEENFLRNVYLHGYQRGRCVPETIDQEATLYERCEMLLHHWLAQLPQTNHEAAERRL